MKKRSAMTVAAGLVAALLAGAVAMSLGFSGGQTASAGSGDPKPRVRTIERTVTIHRKAKPKAPEVVTITAPAVQNAEASLAATSSSDDDSQEEVTDDDQFEGENETEEQDQVGEDREDEGHEDDGGFGDD